MGHGYAFMTKGLLACEYYAADAIPAMAMPGGHLRTSPEFGGKVPDHDVQRAARDSGSLEIERAHGKWQHGRWADFDPTKDVEPMEVPQSMPRAEPEMAARETRQ